jgi:hypothetical protein
VEGTPVEGKNHPCDQRLHREEEEGAQKYKTMQFEADGHTYELTNVSKGETQQPLKSWGKIADEKEPVSVQVVEGLAYFPSAFNSSHVLPPCLRRRSQST